METKPKEKWTVGRIIKWFMIIAGIISVLSGVVYFLVDYGRNQQAEVEYKKDQKDVTFEDKTQRDKAIDYVNADVTPIRTYLLNDTVAKRQDTLIQQQAFLDTILNNVYEQRELDMKERRQRAINDSIENIALVKNRKEKYELQKKMLNKLEDIDLRQRDFKKELQKIKDSL